MKYWHSKIMNEFSSVNSESFLIGLISDTISYFGTEHHLVASHEVKHDIFQCWLKRFRVDEIEVYLVVSGHLNSLVSFDKVNETSHI
jgi:hypothetical protein